MAESEAGLNSQMPLLPQPVAPRVPDLTILSFYPTAWLIFPTVTSACLPNLPPLGCPTWCSPPPW